jgi:hypothetical protein
MTFSFSEGWRRPSAHASVGIQTKGQTPIELSQSFIRGTVMGRQNASDLRPIYHPIAGIADVCLWQILLQKAVEAFSGQ